ncbi:MAG: alpha/beta fold hydrolase [Acidobacteria bacterium]|nr:alpha/beta fold hydrolase [Acidobacteriota bacterium]MBI3657460.1 alpha/beta fold hydrolase [Acidobacteriota bacterium]
MLGTVATIAQNFYYTPPLPAFREPWNLSVAGKALWTGWLAYPAEPPKALVVVCHGLGGDAEGPQVRRVAAHLLKSRYAVMAWNGRGMLDSESYDGQTHHAGRCDDLEIILTQARDRYPHVKLAAVGISLGGHIVLRHSLLYPYRMPRLAICAPLNLKEAALGLDRHPFFRRFYVRGLMRRYPCHVQSIVDFDEKIVAPANGFSSAFDYYEKMSVYPCRHELPDHVRGLVGCNDPVVPSQQWIDMPNVTWQSGGHLGQGFPGRLSWPVWVVQMLTLLLA